MSTTDPSRTQAKVRQPGSTGARYPKAGEGWVLFAGTMLAVLATLNVIDGIAAVSNSNFFVGQAEFVFADLKTWGWIVIIVGVIQGVTALGVFLRWHAVRWVGVAIAGLNAVAQLLILPAYPLWALCLFSLDLLVMYGLIVYGGPQE